MEHMQEEESSQREIAERTKQHAIKQQKTADAFVFFLSFFSNLINCQR
jgi:hypothetical protein